MKKIISLIILVVVVAGGAFFFFNQEKTPEQQIVGTWYEGKRNQTITFNKDKSMEMVNTKGDTRTGTWTLTGEELLIEITSDADASAEVPKGEIKSLYVQFIGVNEAGFPTFSGTFNKK